MRAQIRFLILLFLGALFCHAGDEPERRVMGKSDEVSLSGKVVLIRIGQDDLTNKQAYRFWHRTLARASEDKARAVVLELNTPGGLAFDTRNIIVDDFGKLGIPLIAWVEREALSAGALITFSADRIYMAPGTTIGSAGIINSTGQKIEKMSRAKAESAFGASMRSVVKKKGHRMDVLEAMMFIDDENERTFGSVTVPKGGLLNLTAEEAIEIVDGKPLLALGLAESLDQVLAFEGLENVEVVRPEPTGFEVFAWWIAAFSPLLIAIGIGAAYLEMKAPGFGLFGFISLIAFSFFFFGNNLAGNLAGYELMAVFLLGVLLIILEIFLFPGLIAGVIGGVLVIGSLWFAMADKVSFERAADEGELASSLGDLLFMPALMLSGGILGGIGLMLLFIRFLPRIPLFRTLSLDKTLASGSGSRKALPNELVGSIVVAVSDLRPSGTIMVEGKRHDAISRDGWIEKGSEVRILEQGMTFMVESASAPSAEPPAS